MPDDTTSAALHFMRPATSSAAATLGVGQRNDRQVSPCVGQVSQRAAGVDVNERHFAREPLSRHVVAQHFGLHMGIRLFGMFG
jgi:hypothetical protein